MRQAMDLKITPSVWLNVGAINDQTYDKRVALERARRGVEAMGLDWGTIIARDRRGHVADTRHMVSKYLRDCGFSFPEICQRPTTRPIIPRAYIRYGVVTSF
jgi:hypothetical protein